MRALFRTFQFLRRHPFAQRKLINSLQKFVVWQLRTRLFPNRTFIVPFAGTTRMYAKKRLTGVTGNIYTGLHDFEEMCFLLHLLRPSDFFFDVGANVGSYTVLASGAKRARSISFEPNGSTFNFLKNNVVLNDLEPLVQLQQCAVGAKGGSTQFTKDEDTTNHVASQYDNNAEKIEVEMMTLDDFKEQCPVLVKIDVEGYESEVLAGAHQILTNSQLKAIIIELNGSGGRYGFDEELIHQKLLQFGFKPHRYLPYERRLIESPNKGSFNTIYLRDVTFINSRVRGAEKVRIWNAAI